MIDIQAETLLTLADAAKMLPHRNGKPVHTSTVYRWIARGVRGVRLESLRIGGVVYTSVEAVQRFAERLTTGDREGAVRTTRARQAAVKRAERELLKANI